MSNNKPNITIKSSSPSTEAGDDRDGNSNEKFEEIMKERKDLEDQLMQLEQQIYRLEGSYLEETWGFGNVFKGFDGYLSTRSRSTQKKKFKETDRIFSNSSTTYQRAITQNGIGSSLDSSYYEGTHSMQSFLDDSPRIIPHHSDRKHKKTRSRHKRKVEHEPVEEESTEESDG